MRGTNGTLTPIPRTRDRELRPRRVGEIQVGVDLAVGGRVREQTTDNFRHGTRLSLQLANISVDQRSKRQKKEVERER